MIRFPYAVLARSFTEVRDRDFFASASQRTPSPERAFLMTKRLARGAVIPPAELGCAA
jgi:hypothetical protein